MALNLSRFAGMANTIQDILRKPSVLYGAAGLGGAGLGALGAEMYNNAYGNVGTETPARTPSFAPPTGGGRSGVPPIAPPAEPKAPSAGSMTGTADKTQNRGSLERASGDPRLDQLYALIKEQADPERRRVLLEQNAEFQERLQKVSAEQGLAKQQELTARQVELENIKAWRDITTSAYQANAMMAANLASTAYIAATPNANVLSALGTAVNVGSSAFKGPTKLVAS